MHVKISKDAVQELESSALWYEQEQPGLGIRLVNAFEEAVQLLRGADPPLVPVTGRAASLGAKRLLLYGFPFSLIVIKQTEALVVIAFVHFRRRPDYWLDRLDP